jgi:hypothetical protein
MGPAARSPAADAASAPDSLVCLYAGQGEQRICGSASEWLGGFEPPPQLRGRVYTTILPIPTLQVEPR